MYALILALITASSWGTFSTEVSKTLTRSTDGAKITIRATAQWTQWPDVVLVTSRALYSKPLPPCAVRLVAHCVGRAADYIDMSDGGSVVETIGGIQVGRRLGVRCYLADGMQYEVGKQYMIEGVIPQVGRIYGDTIREGK